MIIMKTRHTGQRNRRHLSLQLSSLRYCLERFISCSGPNKDFGQLDEDGQKLFIGLLRGVELAERDYNSFLWDRAESREQRGLDPLVGMPEHFAVKLRQVKDFIATLPKEKTP